MTPASPSAAPTFRERIEARFGSPPDLAAAARQMAPAPGWALLVEIALRAVWNAPADFEMEFGVKEKYGELAFEHERVTSPIHDLMDQLERLSGTMCEVCGAPGTTATTLAWDRTLCAAHRAAVEAAGLPGFRAVYAAGAQALVSPGGSSSRA